MKNNFRGIWILSLFILLVMACTIPGMSDPTSTPPPTSDLPTLVPPPTATFIPTATPIPHELIPGVLPTKRVNHAGDHDSSTTAHQNRAPGGDRFTFGRYERPFNSETMDVYFPYLDIIDTQYFMDDTWIYAVITLVDNDENQALSGRYAIEIDEDKDGGGEWLTMVEKPTSTDWSVVGVQVWFDTNDDVGGRSTVNADDRPPTGNGYETSLFDGGQGDDHDLAWARISPQDSNTIHIALKRSILTYDKGFMIGSWAGSSVLEPQMFDLNDQFNHEQAGAALIELENFYPIKALYELDSACRVPMDFKPQNILPGTCPVAPEQKESCPPEYLFCPQGILALPCYCYSP